MAVWESIVWDGKGESEERRKRGMVGRANGLHAMVELADSCGDERL